MRNVDSVHILEAKLRGHGCVTPRGRGFLTRNMITRQGIRVTLINRVGNCPFWKESPHILYRHSRFLSEGTSIIRCVVMWSFFAQYKHEPLETSSTLMSQASVMTGLVWELNWATIGFNPWISEFKNHIILRSKWIRITRSGRRVEDLICRFYIWTSPLPDRDKRKTLWRLKRILAICTSFVLNH